jgi:titin
MPTKDKSQFALINRIRGKTSYFGHLIAQRDLNNGNIKRINSNGGSAGLISEYAAGSANFTEDDIKIIIPTNPPITNPPITNPPIINPPIINPPSQLSSLTATSITPSGFTVNWSGGQGATSYTYTLNGIPATSSSTNDIVSRSARFTGLEANTSYVLIITALNGTASTISSNFTIITSLPTAPDSPTDVSATPGHAQATVSWTVPFNGGSRFIYYVILVSNIAGNSLFSSLITNSTLLNTVSGQTVSFIVTGLTNGIAYTFTVTARNIIGSSLSSLASSFIIPRNSPSPPTSSGRMTVGITTQTTITFSFNAPSNTGGIPITEYRLRLSLGSSGVPFRIGSRNYAANEVLSIASPGTITILVASTLITTERYIISITANNVAGSSSPHLISQDNLPHPPTISGITTSTLESITFSFNQFVTTDTDNILPVNNYTLGVTLNSLAVPFTIGSTNYSAGQTATINSVGTITVGGLDYSTSSITKTYNLSLIANNPGGSSSPLIITQATSRASLPSSPMLSSETTSTGTSITFSFDSGPMLGGGLPIIDYILSYSSSSPTISSPTFIVNSTTYSLGQSVTRLSTGTVVISGLQAMTTYTFNLYARNSLGNSSPHIITQATT